MGGVRQWLKEKEAGSRAVEALKTEWGCWANAMKRGTNGRYKDLTHSPRIQSPEEMPFDEFDEWYAFDGRVIINDLRPIVSSSSNPDDGETCVPDFWEKIERYEPALVFGDPGSTMNPWVISRDRELLERIASWGLARGSGCDG